MAAAIATVLELSLKEIPEFEKYEEWQDILYAWLNQQNLEIISVKRDPKLPFLYIANGKSPRGDWLYSVVYQEGRMVFDPHPEGQGLIGTLRDFWFFEKQS